MAKGVTLNPQFCNAEFFYCILFCAKMFNIIQKLKYLSGYLRSSSKLIISRQFKIVILHDLIVLDQLVLEQGTRYPEYRGRVFAKLQ